MKPVTRLMRLRDKALAIWAYLSDGVWTDHRDSLKVNIIKTANLTVRTFMSSDLQTKAAAMTYRTILAVVPALALLFAIGRGFGLDNVLQTQLFSLFPSQAQALSVAFRFVDSTLAQASEGIFVGVGVVFLLWTIISLLSSVEETFNQVWGVTAERSIFRKVTDYLAICIILPVLMVVSGGLQIFMSSAIQHFLPFEFLTPLIEYGLDFLSYVFAWLFFAGAYMLIPNTKVKFSNAFISGVIAGTAFQVLQWLFIHGQMGVAKYNAIYGSFSFLPLMLLWMQFSWLITLAGALICSAAQNISMFSFNRHIRDISTSYRRKVLVAVLSVIVKRFKAGEKPLSCEELSGSLQIPVQLVRSIINTLTECNLIVHVSPLGKEHPGDLPVQPSMSLEHYTLSLVLDRLRQKGESDFLPDFASQFPDVIRICDNLWANISKETNDILIEQL